MHLLHSGPVLSQHLLLLVSTTGILVKPSRSPGAPALSGQCASLFRCVLQMTLEMAGWSAAPGLVRTAEPCNRFDPVQPVHGKSFHLRQFFPCREESVLLPIIDDAICKILRDSRKLRQFAGVRRVQINLSWHDPMLTRHSAE